jgi:hypothetical protein
MKRLWRHRSAALSHKDMRRRPLLIPAKGIFDGVTS